MIVHQVFAEIVNGKVENIMVCEDYETANMIARATYGDDAIAVDCLQYPCQIGDKYINNAFYHTAEDGEDVQVKYVPTESQSIETLNKEMEDMNEYVVELDYQASLMSLNM